ncbi:MAG TPA: hypothetical protein VED66_09865 [Candidatus Sulfotelmatobacter sp.]|nr:hypothetical protein [Candidatus Sulfotelmatobacter sp.]
MLHRMVHPHGDATDETRRGRADIAGIFRIRLGVAAFDDSQGYFFPDSKTENLILVPFQLVPANPFQNTLFMSASDAWTVTWPK